MANKLVEYRLRIRNAANSADALEVTSVRGGTNPYISEDGIPSGDGASFDPITGKVTSGAFTGKIIDPITSGSSRLFTSIMEDANFRQQLGHRRAFWELREDVGSWTTLYAGRVTAYRLANDIEWSVTVGDFMQAEHEFTAFDPEPSETIADFLARWPKRGCLCGGPVIGGFLTQQDLGGWEMRVHDRTPAGGATRYWLEPVSVYGPGGWRKGQNILDFAGKINEAAAELSRGISEFANQALATIDDASGGRTWWPGLIALVNGTPYRLMPPATAQILYGELAAHQDLISTKQGSTGLVVKRDNQSALTAGAIVKVRVLTVLPSTVSPIYVSGHPIDFAAALADEAGLPYDTASVETVRDTLGAQASFLGRFTKPEPTGQLLESAVYGPFGIAARPGSDAELEFFASRIFANVVPSTTIDEDDVIEDETQAFSLNTSEAVKRVIVEHTRITRDNASTALDAFVEQSERFERDSDDPGVIGTGEASYRVPGMIHVEQTIDFNIQKWINGRANEITDRYGRGPIRFKTTIIRGSAAMAKKLGDEILVDHPTLPNKNKRLIDDGAIPARAMQIVHLTPTLRGNEIECIDSGPNANAISTLPTHTIAASSDQPRNVAEATITNAATLNASGYALRLQMATTAGGAPAVEDYTDIAFYAEGAVPTAAIRLPPVAAGRDVYIRARTEKKPERPSNWSTGVGVALDALDAPSAVTGTPSGSDASRAEVVWTIGADADDALVEVWLSLDSEVFADATLIVTLPAGSNRYTLRDLADSEGYTVYIRHRDPTTGDLSATAEDDFSTGATIRTLNPPTHQDGFCFPGRLRRPPRPWERARSSSLEDSGDVDTRYGIAVVATEFPSDTEIQEAVEDSPGAGTYGAFATVARIPSVAGDWTIYRTECPLDGLRRKLKARHVLDGTTASSYTSEVVIDPAVADPIATLPVLPGFITDLELEDGAVTTDKIAPNAVTAEETAEGLRCRASRGSLQSINDSTNTAVLFDVEVFDVGGFHSTVSNTSRFTIPSGGATRAYLMTATVAFAANTTGDRMIQFGFNGGLHGGQTATRVRAANSTTSLQATLIVPAPSAGDYYEIMAWQDSGGALDVIGATFTIIHLW